MRARGVGADVRRVCWPVNDGVHGRCQCLRRKQKKDRNKVNPSPVPVAF